MHAIRFYCTFVTNSVYNIFAIADATRVLVDNKDEIEDFVVDNINKRIYWTEPSTGTIQDASLVDGTRAPLFTAVRNPNKVTLDLNNKFVVSLIMCSLS